MKHRLPAVEQLIRTDCLFTEAENAEDLPRTQSEWKDKRYVFWKNAGEVFYLSASQAEPHGDFARLPWTKTVLVPRNGPEEAAIDAAARYGVVAVADDAGAFAGYIEAAGALAAVFRSYRYLSAYFETLLETTDASISMIDEEGRVVVWTSGAEQLFSIRKSDILGRPMTDFFPPEMVETLRTLKTGRSVFRHQHQPRPDKFVLINTNPVRVDGKIAGAVAAEVDITSQIRLHHELLHMTNKVHHLQKEVAKHHPTRDPFLSIKGTSPALKNTIETIKKISATKATVLILGESGVGKELFAKAIHDLREGEDAPFVAINCGAIPPTLFESELFGYEKGAFSGADQRGKKGKIELARGGTLFLDEIGEMPLEMQVKLLRVLQEKKYFAVGGTQLIDADCRIIAATNRNLPEMVEQGKFREDLFYRLNVVTVEIPPLRERKEDIFELTQAFLSEFMLSYNRHIHEFPPEVMQMLLQYDWPGNIRELRNTLERLVIFATDGIVKKEYLPSSITGNVHRAGGKQAPLPDAEDLFAKFQEERSAFEKAVIQKAIELENGNKMAAAKRLGISRATLYNKMNKLGIK